MRQTPIKVPPPYVPVKTVQPFAAVQQRPASPLQPPVPVAIPPVYRPAPQRAVQRAAIPVRPTPRVNVPATTVQRYTFEKKEQKDKLALKKRYLDADYLESKTEDDFEDMVLAASTLNEIVKKIEALEQKAVQYRQRQAAASSASTATTSAPKPTLTPGQTATPAAAASSLSPVNTQSAKKKKTQFRAPTQSELTQPPAAPVWNNTPATISTPSSQPLKAAATTVPPLTASSPVSKLMQRVTKWNGTSDKGATRNLSESQIDDFLTQCAQISTTSGSNSLYYVGLSVGEAKYNGKVCLKVIAGYSTTTSQATAHKPTFHVQVDNMTTCPASLTQWLMQDK